MECPNRTKNLDFCSCSYSSCSRKGLCCECVRYHISQGEIPGCFFPPPAEKTYNRSVEHFIEVMSKK